MYIVMNRFPSFEYKDIHFLNIGKLEIPKQGTFKYLESV